MALLTINGVDQRTPSKMQVAISDIDGETTRNANGDLIRDRIGTKRKLELDFPPLSQLEISTLLNAVSSVFFSVNYQDPLLGMTTKTFYVGDRTSPILIYGNGGSQLLWDGLKMDFIEK